VSRLHALWSLEGLNELKPADVSGTLQDPHPKVRATAVRLAEQWLGANGGGPLSVAVIKATGDADPGVRLQAAASLGALRSPEAEGALAQLLATRTTQPYLVGAVVRSLRGRELEMLERLGADDRWAQSKSGYEQVFKILGAAVLLEGSATRVKRLLEWTAVPKRPTWQQHAVLGSLTKPVRLSAQLEIPVPLLKAADKRTGALAAQLGERFTWPGKARASGELTSAERSLLRAGEKTYLMNCAPCHQTDARGLADTALPLVGSKWVLGSEELLTKIVLLGKQGKQTLMPPWGNVLDDRQIASVLTYIRHEWGNGAAPVTPETVRKVRGESTSVNGFLTEESLAAEAARLGMKL
jgi:mono/diheme cytochrome c family protein